MFITRKMDYGLRILLTLACHGDERLTSEALAEKIQVPRQFTLKIAQILTRGGLIKAQRGVKGGIQLARPPNTITLADVFAATDSPRALNECLINADACTRSGYCAVHNRLREVQTVLTRELSQTSLADLVCKQEILDHDHKLNSPAQT